MLRIGVERILTEYEPAARAYFHRRGLSPEDVEDLVQEFLAAALTAYARFAGRSSVST